MAAANVVGENYKLEGNSLTVFGWWVRRFESTWAVGIFQVDRDPVSPEIEAVIQQDIAAGNGDRIDHVLVARQIGAILFLEGKLTRQHFLACKETNDSIRFKDVELNGSHYDVVVKSPSALEAQYGKDFRFATIDASGAVV